MFCPKCGTQNPDNALNCVSCGEALQPPVLPPMIQPIPNHLALAIVATVVSTLALCGCCWAFPFCGFGIAAIVFASQVDSKARLGDIQGALAASKNAKMWSLISYGTSLLIVVLSIFLFGIMAFTGALKN